MAGGLRVDISFSVIKIRALLWIAFYTKKLKLLAVLTCV